MPRRRGVNVSRLILILVIGRSDSFSPPLARSTPSMHGSPTRVPGYLFSRYVAYPGAPHQRIVGTFRIVADSAIPSVSHQCDQQRMRYPGTGYPGYP
eukprot:3146372-Rhodomonas_salina.2